jgi:molybdenum cofactor cytidylyltransferase
MSRAPGFCAIILAAGESSRMGRDKALLPWPPSSSALPTGKTFLSAAIESLSFNELVIVVVGNNQAALAPVVYACGGIAVRNPEPERGQFSSLRVGLQEVLNHGRDAAMLTLVDRPPASASTLRALREAFDDVAAQKKWALVPEYGGRHGHPILIGREMIEAFLKAPATTNARDVQHQHQQQIEYFPVDDPLVVQNVNTPEDYARLTTALSFFYEVGHKSP